MELKRFKAGQRGLNRVTAYQRPDSPWWYLEWFENGKRRARNMRHWHGAPVECEHIAEAIAKTVAAQIKSERVMEMLREVVADRPDVATPMLRETARMRAPGPMPGLEHAEHPMNPDSAKGPLPEGVLEAGRGKTMQDLANAYIQLCKKSDHSERTVESYQGAANRLVEYFGEDAPIEAMNPDAAADMVTYFSEDRADLTKGKAKNLVPTSVAKIVKVAKMIYTYANSIGWLSSDRLVGFRMSVDKVHRVENGKCWSEDEFQTMLKTAIDEDWLIALFLWWTWDSGQRIGCQRLLHRDWMSFQTREDGTEVCIIRIPAGADKNRTDYNAILRSPEAVVLAKTAAAHCEENGGFLFPETESGSWAKRRIAGRAISKNVAARLNAVEAAAGIEHTKDRSFHASKSQFATRYFRMGQIEYASKVSHTTVKELMDDYAIQTGEVDLTEVPDM